ncbi:hypothetical protein HLB44_20630 [Aquincola sp. S2]|uniref:Flagellar FliJ protein n=1 Tax=Pseudaquabacterium terrae TaxID=2732868 RepID=A0ABX2ELA5_9BURK|nr:hypothetical protein [Aquabacterium terrae]NRF69410.1 hypothetical protein [Aquabacterium terrae]
MSSDWPRLIRVREQQKAAAAEALATARRAAEHTAARRDEAQQTLACRVSERAGSWHGAADRFSAGSLDIEQLRRVATFDAVAGRHIADARRCCHAAQAQHQLAETQAEEARGWLHGRRAALEKAERMDERARAALRRQEEQRAEESAEVAALAAWQRGPGRRTA